MRTALNPCLICGNLWLNSGHMPGICGFEQKTCLICHGFHDEDKLVCRPGNSMMRAGCVSCYFRDSTLNAFQLRFCQLPDGFHEIMSRAPSCRFAELSSGNVTLLNIPRKSGTVSEPQLLARKGFND